VETLAFFLDSARVATALHQRGMSLAASRRNAGRYARLGRVMLEQGVEAHQGIAGYWAPGRIEIMGKHTDYAGGSSLLAALERGFCLLATQAGSSESNELELFDAASGERFVLTTGNECLGPFYREKWPAWAIYPHTVLKRGSKNFGPGRCGVRLFFSSDLPLAAGMSSSSAFIIVIFLALRDLFGWDRTDPYRASISDRVDLADYLGHVENGQTYKELPGEKGVGTAGGSQDHAGILCSEPRKAILISFQPTRYRTSIPLPPGLSFCLASSGVRAEKTKTARERYNLAADRARRVLLTLNETGLKAKTLGAMIEDPEFDLADCRAVLRRVQEGRELECRLVQFYSEVAVLLPEVMAALNSDDAQRLATAVIRSQEMAEKHLENQVAETVHLARSALEMGAIAASAFGAGFGGSVWALVKTAVGKPFLDAWRSDYLHAFPGRIESAEFFLDPTGPPACSLADEPPESLTI
jgi:galactokinase